MNCQSRAIITQTKAMNQFPIPNEPIANEPIANEAMKQLLITNAQSCSIISQEVIIMQLDDYFDFLGPDDIRIKGSRVGIETVLYEYIFQD